MNPANDKALAQWQLKDAKARAVTKEIIDGCIAGRYPMQIFHLGCGGEVRRRSDAMGWRCHGGCNHSGWSDNAMSRFPVHELQERFYYRAEGLGDDLVYKLAWVKTGGGTKCVTTVLPSYYARNPENFELLDIPGLTGK